MGCDIHLSIEYRDPTWRDTTHWWTWATNVNGCRDYGMFGYMAGIRSNIRPFVNTKGIPKDLSYEISDYIKNYGSDGHSHTWFSPKEFTIICALRQLNDGTLTKFEMSTDWIVLRGVVQLLEKHYGNDNVRLIAFFDN